MGIGSIALKALKLIPRYAFSDGASKISKARRAIVDSNAKSIFGKGNEFALKNFKKKAEVGWDYLKKDATKTMNSKKSVWASIKSFGKSLCEKPKQAVRVAEKLAARAGKSIGIFGKAGWALKGLGKALKKLPIVGTVLATGYEIYETYGAFKNGGFWEGIKQVGKSALKIGAFAAGTALGAAVGGPVGALIGGIAADMLVGALLGGSYSENHPEPEEQKESTNTESEVAEKQGKSEPETSSSTTPSVDNSNATNTEDNTELNLTAETNDTTNNGINFTNSAITGSINPFGTGLGFTNPFGAGIYSTPTFGTGYGMGMNPFGLGFGMPTTFMGGFGFNNPFASYNLGLQQGENIFLQYPMGYKFQYLG